ncbi:excisionase [Parasphaerochaeta coccoides]|uniref:HipA-like C-terminal domain-containing protein n=1 Tax=Parasphaerochaeta coccoides (strain ATCC BAA-1237 / DSM 17374 / SPN1) TaxID=760011 RepID=F4GJZ7_PARC1|nr:excisionase [Parasphaerochaeta coccoides]AEC01422.1 hypothetical protein Spico_0184 [Parasphaerochaeta coccoides DSM 17374]
MDTTGKYIFMHRDDEAAVVEFNLEDGYLFNVLEVKNENLIPLRANKSIGDFRRWWQDRAVPRTQGSVLNFLRKYDIHTTQGYLLKNFGLSLSDHYWVKPKDSQLAWEDVNLFSHDFAEPFSMLRHNIGSEGYEKGRFSPAASTGGEMPKHWVIQDGERYLIKEPERPLFQQAINEVFATQLHEMQKKQPFVSYFFASQRNDPERIFCACKSFASLDLEFIPAVDLVGGGENTGKNGFDLFIDRCVEGGLDKDKIRDFLEYQIVTDFLISNTDRHLNNFGVLRDTHTLNYVSPAPIFDSGNSMFYLHPLGAASKLAIIDIQTNSVFADEKSLIGYVKNLNCVDVSELPGAEVVETLYSKDPLKTTQANKKIAEGYSLKIDMLNQLQRGIPFDHLFEKEISKTNLHPSLQKDRKRER